MCCWCDFGVGVMLSVGVTSVYRLTSYVGDITVLKSVSAVTLVVDVTTVT